MNKKFLRASLIWVQSSPTLAPQDINQYFTTGSLNRSGWELNATDGISIICTQKPWVWSPSVCQPLQPVQVWGYCHIEGISRASPGAMEPPRGNFAIYPFTLPILTLSAPVQGPPAGRQELGPQSRAVTTTQGADAASKRWTELQATFVFYLFATTTKDQVKSLVNTAIISKGEARLIYITVSKRAEKGCHLRNLMFPDSKELAFTGTFCTITRKKSWPKDHITDQDGISWPTNVCIQLLIKQGEGHSQAIKHLPIWATSLPPLPTPNTSECPMDPMPKKVTFLLINISVYSNQGRALSESQYAKWSLVFKIINKTLILKDSSTFGINYEWDDDKTL